MTTQKWTTAGRSVTWMLANDLDIGCPMERDPLDIADKLRAAIAQQEPPRGHEKENVK
jgi:hypothetical protein